ncbi:hypothetical protein FSP39_008723 [Pinctada imbricata]|uniref:Uncharacterized protein n=1 Tax=Pinctada imbricata TaxID=66713 RepID=A0AA88Y3D0_PINIB|nr:hypothetical protein FSP39_008723 [Pinctada imbricata]
MYHIFNIVATLSSTKSPDKANLVSKTSSMNPQSRGHSSLTSPVSSPSPGNKTSYGTTWYSPTLHRDSITTPIRQWTTSSDSTVQTDQFSKTSHLTTRVPRTSNTGTAVTMSKTISTKPTTGTSSTQINTKVNTNDITSMGLNTNAESKSSQSIPTLPLSSVHFPIVSPSSSIISTSVTASGSTSTDNTVSSSVEHHTSSYPNSDKSTTSNPFVSSTTNVINDQSTQLSETTIEYSQTSKLTSGIQTTAFSSKMHSLTTEGMPSSHTESFKRSTLKSPVSSSTNVPIDQSTPLLKTTTEYIQTSNPTNGMQTTKFSSTMHSLTIEGSPFSKSTYQTNTAFPSEKVKTSLETRSSGLPDLSTAEQSSMSSTMTVSSKFLPTLLSTVTTKLPLSRISSASSSTMNPKSFTTIATSQTQTSSQMSSEYPHHETTVGMTSTVPNISKPLTTKQTTVIMHTSHLKASSPSSATTAVVGKFSSYGSSTSEQSPSSPSIPASSARSTVMPASTPTRTTESLAQTTSKILFSSSYHTETTSEPTKNLTSLPISSSSMAVSTPRSITPENTNYVETSSATASHASTGSNNNFTELTTIIIRETPAPTRTLLSRSAGVIAGVCSVSATFIIIISLFCYFKVKANKKPFMPLDDRIEVPTNNIAIKMDMIVKEYELPPDDTEKNKERQLNHI